MSFLQQAGMVVAGVTLSAAIGVMTLNSSSSEGISDHRRALPVVEGPGDGDEVLRAQAIAATVYDRGGSEVKISGIMHGVALDEIVFRSQETPDLLRLGWQAPDHLVISVPQYPQDAGKAIGAGDSLFHCGPRTRHAVLVTCESYPVGLRAQ